MAERDDTDNLEPVVIGPDGFAMLALSVVLMLVSLGTSLLLAFGYVLWTALHARHVAPAGSRIVVLGMRLDETGEPTPHYRARPDQAWTLWQRTPESGIAFLGGRTSSGIKSESDGRVAHLRAHRVPDDRLHSEDRSRHTLENLLHYRERFPHCQGEQPLLITSRFHLARCSLLAADLALRTRLVQPKPAGSRRFGISLVCCMRRC